jgi:hypothetical protein
MYCILLDSSLSRYRIAVIAKWYKNRTAVLSGAPDLYFWENETVQTASKIALK